MESQYSIKNRKDRFKNKNESSSLTKNRYYPGSYQQSYQPYSTKFGEYSTNYGDYPRYPYWPSPSFNYPSCSLPPTFCSPQQSCCNSDRSISNISGGCPYAPPQIYGNGQVAIPTWKVDYLVSNYENKALNVDPDLVNPWGIVLFNNELWVTNSMTDSLTNYDIHGNKLLGTIRLRDLNQRASFPTGLVINDTGGFVIKNNNNIAKPASLIIANDQDTIHGYNQVVDPRNTIVVVNNRPDNVVSIFKGVAIANNTLYAADFFGKKIQVFNDQFQPLVGYDFIDGDVTNPIPADYAPNNIVSIGCYLYVLYAKINPDLVINNIDGPGNGYISVFNTDGTFVKRFYSRGVLNSPWAMIPAPDECSFPEGSFLVSNNGDGRINVFDKCGNFVGPLLAQSGLPLEVYGVHGLAPRYCDKNVIFFAAADNNVGLVGRLEKDQYVYLNPSCYYNKQC